MARRSKLTYNPKADYYQILGINSDATAEIIQRAYRQKAKEFHPDLNPEREEWAKSRFQLISEAYRVLTDTELRQDYNNLRWRFKTFSAGGSVFNWDSASNTPQSEPLWTAPPPRPRRARRTENSGQWLEDLGFGQLIKLQTRFTRHFGSPYRYILFGLGTVVVFNIVLVIAGFAFTGGIVFDDDIQVGVDFEPTPISTSTLTNNVVSGTISANNRIGTPTPVTANCSNDATFHIDDLLTIDTLQGTIDVPDMQTYEITAFFLDNNPDNPPIGTYLVRPRSASDTPEASVVEQDLVRLSDTLILDGYYQIQLNVFSVNRQIIEECVITIYWQSPTN